MLSQFSVKPFLLQFQWVAPSASVGVRFKDLKIHIWQFVYHFIHFDQIFVPPRTSVSHSDLHYCSPLPDTDMHLVGCPVQMTTAQVTCILCLSTSYTKRRRSFVPPAVLYTRCMRDSDVTLLQNCSFMTAFDTIAALICFQRNSVKYQTK